MGNGIRNKVKKKYREWKKRFALAKYALRGKDFIHESNPGHLLTRQEYQTQLPNYSEPPESENRAALLGRATEPTIRYVAFRDLRKKWESGDGDLMKVVGEMAQMRGYDKELVRAFRVLEEKYEDKALRNIRNRLEVSKEKWEDGEIKSVRVYDPRLQWQMRVQTTARDHLRDDSDMPPGVQRAIENAPREALSQIAGSEESHPLNA